MNLMDSPPQNNALTPRVVIVSAMGTGCGVVGMWGICSPIRLPICNPDKAFGTRAEEEEVSGFTAGLLPGVCPCGQK